MRENRETISQIIAIFEGDNNVRFNRWGRERVQSSFEQLPPVWRRYLNELSEEDLSEAAIGDQDGPMQKTSNPDVRKFFDRIFHADRERRLC